MKKTTNELERFIKGMIILSLAIILILNWISGLTRPPQLISLLDLFIKSVSLINVFTQAQIFATSLLPFYICIFILFFISSLVFKIKWIDKETRLAKKSSFIFLSLSIFFLLVITMTSILDTNWFLKMPALFIFFVIFTTLAYTTSCKENFEGIKFKEEKRHRFFLILLAIVIIGIAVRIINLGKLNLWVDEILTYQAAQSILEKGYPTTETGIFYPRAVLFSYISALPLKIWEFSEFVLRLPSVIFGTLTIFVTYYLGKIVKNEIVGITSALIISLFYWQVEFSRYARMYQQFQFFFLLSLLLFFKAYLEEKSSTKWKVFWLISYIGCIFSHQLAITLLPIFVFTLWKKRLEVFKNKLNYFIFFIILQALVLRFILFDKILAADLLTNVGSQEVQLIEFSFKNSFLLSYIRIYPLFSGLLIATILGLWVNRKMPFKTLSVLFLFIFCNILVNIIETKGQPRYIFYLFPLFIILTSYSINTLITFLLNRVRVSQNTLINLLANLLLFGYLILPMRYLFDPLPIIQREYNDDLSAYSFFLPSTAIDHYPNYEEYAEFIDKNIKDEDIIIATNPIFLNLYLDENGTKSNYWLRQIDLGHYSKFSDIGLVSIYDNTTFLDSRFDLEQFMGHNDDHVIWIVVDSTLHLNDPVIDFLEENRDNVVFQTNGNVEGIYKFEKMIEL